MNYLTEIRDTLVSNSKLSEWFATDPKMIFVGNIPPKYIERNDVTTVLITGLSNTFTAFGGNTANAREQEVEIKIWYAPNVAFERFEWALNEALEHIGFHAFSFDGPKVDEENKQNKSILQIRRTKFKGE